MNTKETKVSQVNARLYEMQVVIDEIEKRVYEFEEQVHGVLILDSPQMADDDPHAIPIIVECPLSNELGIKIERLYGINYHLQALQRRLEL